MGLDHSELNEPRDEAWRIEDLLSVSEAFGFNRQQGKNSASGRARVEGSRDQVPGPAHISL
jgi:hypothetical protein